MWRPVEEVDDRTTRSNIVSSFSSLYYKMSTSSESGLKFRVAICGAGIAGLVLVITIGKYDPSIPIDLYEAHDSINTAGAGFAAWRQTHGIIIELGLFDEFRQIFTHDPDSNSRGFYARRSDIREGGYIWYPRVDHLGKDGASFMHRQHMVAIQERHLPASCILHSRKQLVDYTEPEQRDAHAMSAIILNFADGTTAATDVLVGADGIRPAVRKTLYEAASEDKTGDDNIDLKQYIEASFTGMTVYRCLISAETLRKEGSDNLFLRDMMEASMQLHMRTNPHLIPLSCRAIINVTVVISDPSLTGTLYEGHWVPDASRDELVEYFDNFEPDARTVVKHCEKPSKWALHVVKPLPFCARKRVAIIGDADAFVLGRLIVHPLTTPHRIQDALHIYEEIRLPIARYYDGTKKEDDVDESGVGAYEREGMETVKQEILRRWDWALPPWKDAESTLRALTD
ncbi:hypothetical protein J3R83DRAFT_13908 [Lanmaoa asiatica]|nr:hypothetical protein J3R83DRAFT_13908 [Lanmaoa asiatica]